MKETLEKMIDFFKARYFNSKDGYDAADSVLKAAGVRDFAIAMDITLDNDSPWGKIKKD